MRQRTWDDGWPSGRASESVQDIANRKPEGLIVFMVRSKPAESSRTDAFVQVRILSCPSYIPIHCKSNSFRRFPQLWQNLPREDLYE
jgi:hypothetical protein